VHEEFVELFDAILRGGWEGEGGGEEVRGGEGRGGRVDFKVCRSC
jgi:hypothetical protein